MRIPPFALERFFAQYEFTAPYLLCGSDCESVSIEDLLNLEPDLEAAFHRQWLGYTESQGAPELRLEIAGLYQTMAAGQILVHAGAEEAIFNFMNAMLSAGDHVIVHYPCYQSLIEIARAIGCRVTKWETRESETWALDLDFLRQNIKPDTKAVVVNCPHNPTGYLMDHQTQQQLVNIVREHNVLLFFDEVYRGMEYNPDDRLPAACDLYENAVSLGVMSKTYGLAGLRIGWIATQNQQVYQAMAAFKDYTSICNSAPSEFLSIVALRHKEKIVQRNVNIILSNLEQLDEFFEDYQHVFNWIRPKAGSIAFPGLKTDTDIESFCLDLIEKEGVLLLPGNYYQFDGPNFRIGFGRKTMPQALERFAAYMKDTF